MHGLRQLSGWFGQAWSERSLSPRGRSLDLRYDAVALRWQEMLSGLGYPQAYAVLAREHGAQPAGRVLRRVLDIGTGTGAMSVAFCEKQQRLQALDLLDISPAMLAIAQRRLAIAAATVNTWQGAIGQVVLPSRSYDAILCAHALEHLDDPDNGIAWMRDLLLPGGRLVLAVSKPHWCTSLIRWRWGSHAYSSAEVVAMLTRQGFADIRVIPFPAGPPSRTSCGYLAIAPMPPAGRAA